MTTITITLPRAVVEQALEALEFKIAIERKEKAITALRAALAQEQAEQTWVCPEAPEERTYQKPGHCENCGKTLVLAQPNPPGCDHCNHPLYAATKCRVCGRVTEQAEPVEPVAWLWKIKAVDEGPHTQQLYFFPGDDKPWSDGWTWTPLYTAPPQRKPLTEEEIAELARQEQFLLVCDGLDELTEIARAIERTHGIGEER